MRDVTVRGVVSRILSLGPGGGAIFVLEAQQAKDRTRVVAAYDVLEFEPRHGESVVATGTLKGNATYGIQLQASSVKLILPDEAGVLPLLLRNPAFACVSRATAKRLCKTFGASLFHLDHQDGLALLVDAGILTGDALQILEVTRRYRVEVQVRAVLQGIRVPSHVVETLVCCWTDADKRVEANPYCLSTMLSWKDVDGFGRSRGVHERDDRRLLGAFKAAFAAAGRRTHWTLSRTQLRTRLHRMLGDAASADVAIEAALSSHQAVVRGQGPTARFQDRAAAAYLDATFRKLSNACSQGAIPRVRCLLTGEPNSHRAVDLAARTLPNAVHILPGAQHLAAAGSVQSVLVADLLCERESGSNPRTGSAVVHLANRYDLLTLSKVLRRAMQWQDLTLVGCSTADTGVEQDNLLFQRVAQDAPSPLFESTLTQSSTELEVQKIEVAGLKDATLESLRAYRQAVDNGSAIVICATEDLVGIINATLHNEALELRRLQHQNELTARLSAHEEVFDGEPLRVTSTHMPLGLGLGMQGHVVSVSRPPEPLTSSTRSRATLKVRLGSGDTRPLPDWSLDCVALGYAATLESARLGLWDTVIVLCDGRRGEGQDWLRQALTLASKHCVVIGRPEHLAAVASST